MQLHRNKSLKRRRYSISYFAKFAVLKGWEFFFWSNFNQLHHIKEGGLRIGWQWKANNLESVYVFSDGKFIGGPTLTKKNKRKKKKKQQSYKLFFFFFISFSFLGHKLFNQTSGGLDCKMQKNSQLLKDWECVPLSNACCLLLRRANERIW